MAVGTVAAGIAVGGILLSSFSQFKAANAEASLLRKKADLNDFSASKILELNEENSKRIREDAKNIQGAARNQFAASGTLTDLDTLGEIALAGELEIRLNTEEAVFQAEPQRLLAEIQREAASSSRKTGAIGAAGSILQGAALFK